MDQLLKNQENMNQLLKNQENMNQLLKNQENIKEQERTELEEQSQQKETEEKVQTKLQQKAFLTEESEIEININKLYKDILKDKKLKQFGYDFFKRTTKTVSPVGDDYVLGPGDKLKIYLWGDPVDIMAINREFTVEVSRDGTGYVPNIGQLTLSGLSIRDLKNILQKKYGDKFKNLKVDITLEKLRSFNVYVTGFVREPGMITVNSLDTVIDALYIAGGVSKTGSLRKIQLKRKEDSQLKIYNIDLYSLFIEGNPVDIKLRDGDVIYVPPIGDVVAIFGDIKRPAIYELKDERELKNVINFAGGFNASVNDSFVRISRFAKDGVEIFEGDLTDKEFLKTKIVNGDFIFFGRKPDIIQNAITISGEVYYPGIYSINDTKTLKEILLKAKPKPNALYGRVIREDKNQLDFVIEDILKDKRNIDLKALDKIEIYNKFFVEPVYVSGEIDNPKTIPYYEDLTLIEALRSVKFKYPLRELKAIIIRNNMNFITVYLYDLLNRFDQTKDIKLYPGDVVIIQKTFRTEKAPSVTVLGEVKNPGKYEITEGETIADIIAKAGGYTESAYPQALIFIRESAKKLQKEKLEITIITLEEQFIKSSKEVSFSNEEEKQIAMLAIQEQKNLLQILKKKAELGIGRIALDIPATLMELKNSNQNIALEDGDTIIVPQRPNYVLVIGDVYNQISLPYIKGYKLKDYLAMVGGVGKNADKKDIYVIKANGRVVSGQSFSRGFLLWSGIEDYEPSQGDTIVVPTELKIPIAWRSTIKDVVQIIFQSISTAVLAKRL
ncbi:MAG: SLBB domain-containing protein [Hydrogenothermaceae bacterium]